MTAKIRAIMLYNHENRLLSQLILSNDGKKLFFC